MGHVAFATSAALAQVLTNLDNLALLFAPMTSLLADRSADYRRAAVLGAVAVTGFGALAVSRAADRAGGLAERTAGDDPGRPPHPAGQLQRPAVTAASQPRRIQPPPNTRVPPVS